FLKELKVEEDMAQGMDLDVFPKEKLAEKKSTRLVNEHMYLFSCLGKEVKKSKDMENNPHESIDTVFNCIIPYIQNDDDRNFVSLVCRHWYELDSMTRKLLTVHLLYYPKPSRLHQRFPSIESLTLKGLPYWFKRKSSIEITPWVQQISVSYKCLKALHIRRVVIRDSDLELLAKTRGKDLRVLKIYKCEGFSTYGLLHIGKYCNDLKTLCLDRNSLDVKDDLTSLAKSCSQSLVFLKIPSCDLVDVFSYDVRLEEFYGDGEFVFSLPLLWVWMFLRSEVSQLGSSLYRNWLRGHGIASY
ncbi:coronatine-insensitive protein 1-like protein, partial [Tanacetum coccineum]